MPSGVARLAGHQVEVDAEDAGGRSQALLSRHLEEDVAAHLHGEPGVVEELLLKLPRLPAGAAQADQEVLRARTGRQRMEHVHGVFFFKQKTAYEIDM